MRRKVSDVLISLGSIMAISSYSIPYTLDKMGMLDQYYFLFTSISLFLLLSGIIYYKENIFIISGAVFFGLLSVFCLFNTINDYGISTQFLYNLTIILSLAVLVIYGIWKLLSYLKI